jgi:hypothetical protein
MTSLVDNPAAVDPMKALTPGQRDALLSIAAFRRQMLASGEWRIGPKRFRVSTINSIERMQLIAPPLAPGKPIRITTAGQLAIEKLKGKSK